MGAAAMRGTITATVCNQEIHTINRAQHGIMVGNAITDDVDDLNLLLKAAAHCDHRGRHDLPSIDLELVRPEDSCATPVSSSMVTNNTPFAEGGAGE